jgi:hypothetical protein
MKLLELTDNEVRALLGMLDEAAANMVLSHEEESVLNKVKALETTE